MTRGRGFCGADFETDINGKLNLWFWKDICNKKRPKVKYCCIGNETCPKTGRKHLQWYIYFENEIDEKTVRKMLKPRHVILARGSAEDNCKYSSKEELAFEFGEKPKRQGERTDLIEIKNEIVNGTSVQDIMMDKPMLYHQYGRTLNAIEDVVMKEMEN